MTPVSAPQHGVEGAGRNPPRFGPPHLLLVWAVGAAPAAVRVWGHGQEGRVGAFTIGGISLAAVLSLRWVHSRLGMLAVALLSCSVAAAATVPELGRSPVIVATLATILLAWATHPGAPIAAAAVFVIGVTQVAWVAKGRLSAESLGLSAAAVLVLGSHRRWRPVAAIDTALRRAFDRGTGPIRSGWVRAGSRGLLPAGRGGAGQALIVGIAIFVAMLPVYLRLTEGTSNLIRGQNDLPGTLEELTWFRWWPLRLSAPHFLLPVATRLLGSVIGSRNALALICAAAAGAVFGQVASLDRSDAAFRAARGLSVGAVAALWLFLTESPALLVTPDLADLHHWASATDMVLLAFFIPLLVGVVDATDRLVADPTHSDRAEASEGSGQLPGRQSELPSCSCPSRWTASGLALLGVLATLAKPSLSLVAVAVFPLFIFGRAGWSRRSFTLAAAIALPMAVVLMWQVWFLRAGQTPFDSASGWQWRPLWVFSQPGMDRPAFYVMLAFIPLMLAIGRRAWLSDRLVAPSLLLWVAAQIPTLLFQETGQQALHANLAVGSRVAFFLVVAMSLVWLVGHRSVLCGDGRVSVIGWTTRTLFGLLMGLAMVAGTIAYLDAVGAITW